MKLDVEIQARVEYKSSPEFHLTSPHVAMETNHKYKHLHRLCHPQQSRNAAEDYVIQGTLPQFVGDVHQLEQHRGSVLFWVNAHAPQWVAPKLTTIRFLSDDNKLLSWNVSSNEATQITEFAADLLPTDLHFLPRVGGALGKFGDLILVTASDGRFHIVNRSGRIERSTEAHKGAILAGQWSGDGSSFLTGMLTFSSTH